MKLMVPSVRVEGPVEHVVIFVAPAEAVAVLRDVIAQMHAEFPAAILILLHSGTGKERPVAVNLNTNPRLPVSSGIDGTLLRNGRAYIVSPFSRLEIAEDARLRVAIDAGEDKNGSDPLLSSLARIYGVNGIAVSLTEVGALESEGFRLIREAGGHTIALDETERLWEDSSGPRVNPSPEDELVPANLIGPRLWEILESVGASA